jgi:anti-anti-sigma factor
MRAGTLAFRRRGLTEDRTGTVFFTGDLDVSRRDAIVSALPPPDAVDRLVIDCSTVTSIDSAAIAALMHYRRQFAETGRDPLNIVVIASDPVRRVFETLGLTKLMTILTAPRSEPPVANAFPEAPFTDCGAP